MSKYTTGEVAKLCGVTVRTVQYYDARGILNPSELTEGGRRVYSEDDLKRMKIICFLRDIGIPISGIGKLFSEEHPEQVISLLLEQQEQTLRSEIAQQQDRLDLLETLTRELKSVANFSVESIGDIVYKMENRKKLRKMRTKMLVAGLLMDLIEIGTIILGAVKGIWYPFAIGMCVVVAMGVWISWVYYKKVAYICPECHTVFQPKFKEAFFAPHTPNLRKLTCPNCHRKGMCVETYRAEEPKNG